MGGGQARDHECIAPNSAHSNTMSMQQVFSSPVDCRPKYSKSLNWNKSFLTFVSCERQ
jgi:hypothetical protein